MMSDKSVDEKELVKECLAGNRQAQHMLYKLHSAKMLGVCYRYARSLADAEDLLQEGFVKVFRSLSQFRSEGSLEGWIRKIMINCSLNYIKKEKHLFEPVETADEKYSSQNTILETRELMDEIRRLPAGFRTVFNLFAIEGYSHKEIGTMLSIGESTSRSQYARARALLAKRIGVLTTEKKENE